MGIQIDLVPTAARPPLPDFRPTVLAVGDFSPAEFREAHGVVVRDAQLSSAPAPDLAVDGLRRAGEEPEMIVIAQPWPGMFCPESVERLRRAAPLARIWVLLGAWSSGESQSGQPWPGMLRIYWHQWAARWQREMSLRSTGRAGSWTLPITSTDDERLLADACEPSKSHRGLIILISRQPDLTAALADACRAGGYATLALRPGTPTFQTRGARGAAAVLWDVTPEEISNARAVQSLSAQFEGAPIVALLDFPRAEDVETARIIGIASVVGKPFRLQDLFGQLSLVAGATRSLMTD